MGFNNSREPIQLIRSDCFSDHIYNILYGFVSRDLTKASKGNFGRRRASQGTYVSALANIGN